MLVLERHQQFLESIAQPAAQDSRAGNHRTGLKVICRLTSSRVFIWELVGEALLVVVRGTEDIAMT